MVAVAATQTNQPTNENSVVIIIRMKKNQYFAWKTIENAYENYFAITWKEDSNKKHLCKLRT